MKRSKTNVRLHRLVRRRVSAVQRGYIVAATQGGIAGQAARKTSTKSGVSIAERPALCAIGWNTRTRPGPVTKNGIRQQGNNQCNILVGNAVDGATRSSARSSAKRSGQNGSSQSGSETV